MVQGIIGDSVGFEWAAWDQVELGSISFNAANAKLRRRSRSLGKASAVVKKGKRKVVYPRMFEGIHRSFAALSNEPGDILNFIKAYGFLGLDGENDPSKIQFELIDDIKAERDEMELPLKVIDEFLDEKDRKLNLVRKREWNESLEQGFVKLTKRTVEYMNIWSEEHLRKMRFATIIPSTEKTQISFQIQPANLLSYMWLAMLEELAGSRFRLCRACQKIMSVGRNGKYRADAVTCSDNCRQKLSRGS